MMNNIKFKNSEVVSKDSINTLIYRHGEIFPQDYINFLIQVGGQEIEHPDGEICLSTNSIDPEFVVSRFYGIEEIKEILASVDFKSDLQANIPFNKYFIIGEGEMQNYIVIGNAEENLNKLYWYNDEELELVYLCDGLQLFFDKFLIEYKF